MCVFAILAQIVARAIDHRRGVVINAFLFDFVNRHDQRHVMLARQLLHALDGGAVRDRLGQIVPAGLLLGAEIGAVEDFLKAGDLRAALRPRRRYMLMLRDHRLLHFFKRTIGAGDISGLNQRAADHAGHSPPFGRFLL